MATRSIFGGQAPPYNFPTTFGTAGQVLHTDGAGTLSWGAGSSPASTFTDISVSNAVQRTVGAVTQTTSLTTAVTINTPCGIITCFPPAVIAPGVTTQFLVNCGVVSLGDLVTITVQAQSVTAGSFFTASAHQVIDNAFSVQLCNVGSVPATGTLVLGYEITKAL